MKRALDDIAEKDPRARNARPEQFIDASLMQELEKEGFINNYGDSAGDFDTSNPTNGVAGCAAKLGTYVLSFCRYRIAELDAVYGAVESSVSKYLYHA